MATVGQFLYPGSGIEVLEEEYDENFEPTQKDVLEQCDALGINPLTEPDLIYIAREALKAPLPESWKPITDGHGGIYYYNFNTHESTWEHPCDTFYQNMLQKEREKKRSLRKGEINTKQEKGGHLGLKKPPLLGPVSHGGKPELPVPLTSTNMKPPLAPLGGNSGIDLQLGSGTRLAPIGGLPSLKSTNSSLDPISSLKAPPLSMPISGGESRQFGSSKGTLAMPTKSRRVGDKERGFHDTTKEGGPLKPIKNLLHNGELIVGPISTQFEEEEESEESETSDMEGNSFEKKFNVVGMDDFGQISEEDEDSTSNHSITSNRNIEKNELKQSTEVDQSNFKPVSLPNNKSSFTPLIKTTSTSGSPSSSPLMRPGAAKGNRPMGNNSTTQGTVSVKIESSEGTSSSAMKLVNTKERGDLEKAHQDMMDKIRQQHAKQLDQLQEQFSKEINAKREEMEKEKEQKITLTKDKLELEKCEEESRLQAQQKTILASIREKLKEKEEEEEAQLQEKKEDFLRNIRKKTTSEQEEEEKNLKKAKEEALKSLRSSIEKDKKMEEDTLRAAMLKEVEMLKKKLEGERESEVIKLKEEHEKYINQKKKELEQQLEKAKQELSDQNTREIDTLKRTISSEHEHSLENIRRELSKNFEVQRNELEEQKSLQSALKEEAVKSIELIKAQLQENHEKELASLKITHKEQLQQLKLNYEEELDKETKRYEVMTREAKESLIKQHEEKLTELRSQLENEEKQLLTIQIQQNEELSLVKTSLEKDQKKLEELKLELETKKQALEDQQADLNTKSEELQKMKDQVSESQSRETKKNLRAELSQLRQSIQHEQTALDKLIISREALVKEIKKLCHEKKTLMEEIHILINKKQLQDIRVSSKTSLSHTNSSDGLTTPTQPVVLTNAVVPDISPPIRNLDDNETTMVFTNKHSEVPNKTTPTNHAQESITRSSSDEELSQDELTEVIDERDPATLHTFDLQASLPPPPPPSQKASPHSHTSKKSHSAHHKVHRDTFNGMHSTSTVHSHHEFTNDKDLWRAIQIKMEEESAAIERLENHFRKGTKRIRKIQKTLNESSGDYDEVLQKDEFGKLYSRSHRKHSLPTCQIPTNSKMEHSTSLTQPYLNRIKTQLRENGLLGDDEQYCDDCLPFSKHGSVSCTMHHGGTKMKLQDLQDSSGVSSTSDISSEASSQDLINQIPRYSPKTEQILNHKPHRSHSDIKRHNSSSTDPVLSSTLEKISSQLGEVIHRLDERDTQEPLTFPQQTPTRRIEAEQPQVWNIEHLHVGETWAEKVRPDQFDRELHQRWKSRLDAASRHSSLRETSMSSVPFEPPMPTSKIDLTGQELIRKQTDWLKEFRQSIPKRLSKY